MPDFKIPDADKRAFWDWFRDAYGIQPSWNVTNQEELYYYWKMYVATTVPGRVVIGNDGEIINSGDVQFGPDIFRDADPNNSFFIYQLGMPLTATGSPLPGGYIQRVQDFIKNLVYDYALTPEQGLQVLQNVDDAVSAYLQGNMKWDDLPFVNELSQSQFKDWYTYYKTNRINTDKALQKDYETRVQQQQAAQSYELGLALSGEMDFNDYLKLYAQSAIGTGQDIGEVTKKVQEMRSAWDDAQWQTWVANADAWQQQVSKVAIHDNEQARILADAMEADRKAKENMPQAVQVHEPRELTDPNQLYNQSEMERRMPSNMSRSGLYSAGELYARFLEDEPMANQLWLQEVNKPYYNMPGQNSPYWAGQMDTDALQRMFGWTAQEAAQAVLNYTPGQTTYTIPRSLGIYGFDAGTQAAMTPEQKIALENAARDFQTGFIQPLQDYNASIWNPPEDPFQKYLKSHDFVKEWITKYTPSQRGASSPSVAGRWI